jgi:hypothetical protein
MMRTLLLFVFALGIIGSSMAQKAGLKAVPYGKTSNPYTVNTLDIGVPNAMVANQVTTTRPKTTNATLDTTWIGASRNIYGSLLSQQRCLWYNNTLDAVMATYRGNPGITGYMLMAFLTGNDVVNSWTLDKGMTFTKKAGVMGVTGATACRYPSGVISNPPGNNDINNAYSVMAGPATDGAAWISTYFGSVKYDGTHADLQTQPQAIGELLRQGMYATEDGMVHFCGDGYASDYTSSTLMIRNATLNSGGTYDWTNVDISLDDVIARKTDNSLISFFGDAHMAWNNSGTVGYAFVRGSDIRPDDKPSWVPILFKSVDQGATWNQIPYFDFSTLTEITDWILPVAGTTDVYKPMFTDFGLTVDNFDKPHIFAIIRGAASQNIDSLTYIWTYGADANDADCNYFEVWQDAASDNWNAHHIDTCWSDEVTATESWYSSSTGNVGWDHRVQASRSYDGTKLFGTYTDSDYEFWGTKKYNLNPDLFVFAHDMNTGDMVGPTNVTYFSDVWGISFFNFVSPIAMKMSSGGGSSTYEIPVMVDDIKSTGNNADNPVYHVYVKGVTVDFVDGINDQQISNTKVSACYPNPSNGTAFFDVTIDRNSNVNAIITNVAGQQVSSKNFGLVQKGTRKLAIDNSNLSSGVYFCTITVGDSKFTNKMIVK